MYPRDDLAESSRPAEILAVYRKLAAFHQNVAAGRWYAGIPRIVDVLELENGETSSAPSTPTVDGIHRGHHVVTRDLRGAPEHRGPGPSAAVMPGSLAPTAPSGERDAMVRARSSTGHGPPLCAGRDAFICSFECTFCRDCAERVLGGACPNCGGELVRRPVRPADRLATSPPSTARVFKPEGCQGVTAAERRA